jgi:hypothetical protein
MQKIFADVVHWSGWEVYGISLACFSGKAEYCTTALDNLEKSLFAP